MLCNLCSTDKPETEFEKYWHSTFKKFYTRKQCRECMYARAREWKRNNKKKMIKEEIVDTRETYVKLMDDMTSLDYREKPNTYINDTQKELVFYMMKNFFKWTWNEDTGIWSKDGVKDKNNKWLIFNEKTKYKQIRKPRRKFTLEDKLKIVEQVEQFKKMKWSYVKMSDYLGVSDTVLFKWSKQLKKNDEGTS